MPNLRNMFLYGMASAGGTGGEAAHVLIPSEMAAHRHFLGDNNPGYEGLSMLIGTSQGGVALGTQSGASPGWTGVFNPLYTSTVTGRMIDAAGSPAAGVAHNNIPPYYAVRWITAAG